MRQKKFSGHNRIHFIIAFTLSTVIVSSAVIGAYVWKASAEQNALSDQNISDAYIYLLGRLLVLRQEHLDFQNEGFKWNELIYRKPGGVAWANPNLDVAYSEAWVAVDENTPVILEIPKVEGGRYYTWQMLNGWGETVLNINERTFPQKPYGKYALVLKGSNPEIPSDALRVELPGKKSRVLARVELGSDPQEAVRLQKQFKLTTTGTPKIEPAINIPLFTNDKLPGVEAFDKASEILASEPDINPGMGPLQAKVKATESLVKSGEEGRARVDGLIRQKAIPQFQADLMKLGTTKNGWNRPAKIGNYGSDYLSRSVVDLAGIWANNNQEAVYFTTHTDGDSTPLDGSYVYTLAFPKDHLPMELVQYFWSVIAVDSVKFQVIPNPLNRFLLNKESPLKSNQDGSLTLVFAPEAPSGYPQSNWLPTPAGQNYNLTFRFYGPSKKLVEGRYFPPPIVKVK